MNLHRNCDGLSISGDISALVGHVSSELGDNKIHGYKRVFAFVWVF